jgi:hypothetical protein
MQTVREADIETPSNRRSGLSPLMEPSLGRPQARSHATTCAPSIASFNAPSPSFTAGGVSATWEGAGAPFAGEQQAFKETRKWTQRVPSSHGKSSMSAASVTSESSADGSVTSHSKRSSHCRRGQLSRSSSIASSRQRGGYVYSHESKTMKRNNSKYEIMRRTHLSQVTQDVLMSPKVNIKTGKKPAFSF